VVGVHHRRRRARGQTPAAGCHSNFACVVRCGSSRRRWAGGGSGSGGGRRRPRRRDATACTRSRRG
jgi:hypothetical protein